MVLRIHLLFVFLLSLNSINGLIPSEWLQAMPSGLGFSWGNCGASSDPIQFKTLRISPDPIKIPGNVTINLIVAITSTLPTDIRVSLTLEKKKLENFISKSHVNMVLVHVTTLIFVKNGLNFVQNILKNMVFHVNLLSQLILIQFLMPLLNQRTNFHLKQMVNLN